MSRHVQDARITTPQSRAKLPMRTKPYYRSLYPKLCIGYRNSKDGGGQWLMRAYDGDGHYHQEQIGIADDHQKVDGVTVLDYARACEVVRDRHMRRNRRRKALPEDPTGSYKVRQAVVDYVDYLRNERKSGDTVEKRLNAYIVVNGLAEVECDDLTTRMLKKWRNEISKMPARNRTHKGKQKYLPFDSKNSEHVRRRRASANLTFALLRAALNNAWREGVITSDTDWRKIPPFPETDKPRQRYLELDEVTRLLTHTPYGDLRDLFTGGVHTGARPSELGRVTVRDYHDPSGTLHIAKSKGACARDVVVSRQAQAFFRDLCAGRDKDEPMFLREDGTPWKGQSYKYRTKSAAKKIGIKGMTFYVLRHTYCSHAVMNGMPLLLLARNLGHKNTKMVEKHYGHLADDYIKRQIRRFAPRFGSVPKLKRVTVERERRLVVRSKSPPESRPRGD
jgi:integrase